MASYFEYTVHLSGPVTGKIIWARTPTLSVTKHVRFRHLDDLPPRLREAILDDMTAMGRATGSVAIPDVTEGAAGPDTRVPDYGESTAPLS